MEEVIQNNPRNERSARILERRNQLLQTRALEQMEKHVQMEQEWLYMGHGEYTELMDEEEFLEVSKNSRDVVCHFYKPGSPQCKIVDKHLRLLAPVHMEARFVALDVERCPLLTKRLRIRIIPTIALVKNSQTKAYITGLGNCDDHSTEMLQWRIAKSEVIEYLGDLSVPPKEIKNQTIIRALRRIWGIGKPKKIKKRKVIWTPRHIRWNRGADLYDADIDLSNDLSD